MSEAPFGLVTKVEDVGIFPMVNAYLARLGATPLPGIPDELLIGSISLRVSQTNEELWENFIRLMAQVIEHMMFEVLGRKLAFDEAAIRAVLKRKFDS